MLRKWEGTLRGTQGSRRRIAGAQPGAVKAASPVLNGGDEETGLDRPRLVATQLIHILMHVARHRPIAARGVRIEPTARFYRQVGCLLHRLHGEIARRLEDDRTLATDPGDDRRPVFVIMAAPGLTLLAAPPCAAAQRLLPALLGLALLPSGVIEVIRFHGAFQLAVHLVGQGGIAQ